MRAKLMLGEKIGLIKHVNTALITLWDYTLNSTRNQLVTPPYRWIKSIERISPGNFYHRLYENYT